MMCVFLVCVLFWRECFLIPCCSNGLLNIEKNEHHLIELCYNSIDNK